VQELKAAGAQIVDPVVIPDIKKLLAKRATGPDADEAYKVYFARNPNAPFHSRLDIIRAPDFGKVVRYAQQRLMPAPDASKYYQYLLARQELMINLLKVMADHHLDAIIHKSVEHQPNRISEGMNPPYTNTKGVPAVNTFLVFVPTITVPAGFTTDQLPVGISFLGRPYSDAEMIKLAYSYEQATHHRKPPVLK